MQLQTKIPDANPNVTIINLSGRLDIHYSLEIEEEINKLIEQGRINLIINLQNVEYLSSSGLRIFIATSRQLKVKNGKMKLVRMPDAVKKVFMVVELLDMFEIYDSDEEAIKTF